MDYLNFNVVVCKDQNEDNLHQNAALSFAGIPNNNTKRFNLKHNRKM